MTVSRAIEIIDKWEQCNAQAADTKCGFTDNDICYECPMHVTGKQYHEAIRTLHKFAKQIQRRFEKK